MTLLLGGINNSSNAGTLTSVTATADDNQAGATTIYTFGFITDAGGIPADGKIVITLPGTPGEFDVAGASIAQTTNALTMDGGLTATGAAGVITLVRDGTGTPVAGSVSVGVRIAVIKNHQTASNYTANIETQQGDGTHIDWGTSTTFSITHNSLASFQLNIISNQTAGQNFSITISALDQFSNQVNSFTGAVSLSDLTATISPATTTNFTTGSWTGNVQITQATLNNEISATGQNKSGISNQFDVQAGGANHFSFESINSPQTAGQSFSITIVARDVFENVAASFSSSATLSDITGTINPTATTGFTNGSWTGNVSITKAQDDVEISATQGGITGTSNKFNVQSNVVSSFSIDTISNQAANQPFVITVTALDNFNNTTKQFTGKVDISDLSGTVSPSESDNFSNGSWSGSVTVSQQVNDNVISVTKQGDSETGSSNTFDVSAGGVDHFRILTVADQTAGQSFSITIRAEDSADNLVTSYTSPAALSDLTGTLNPTVTGNFSGGIWTGNVIITKSKTANSISVTNSDKAGTSNDFNVIPASLDYFEFSEISSPQTAGQSFGVSIVARDPFDNQVTDFTGIVGLNDNTLSISPGSTGNFVNGSWTGNVTITTSSIDNKISASGSGKSGESNKFNVIANSLHHFVFDPIATQAAGEPFTVTVTSLDEYGNIAAQFSGKVDISDNSSTISPTQSDNFNNGKWTGMVNINQVHSANVIMVTRQGGSETGNSNSFNVINSNVDHFVISSINTQTAGQTFTIDIRAEDSSDNLVSDFTGTASISDLTGTINPITTGSFSGGEWSGSVSVTQSIASNIITVTSSGKAGESNSFNVNPAALDHFAIEEISSPQTAGQTFTLTIVAEDQFNNLVTSYTNSVSITENTGTISPVVSGNFAAGTWSGNVSITKSKVDNVITVSGSGKNGSSNKFNVIPASLHHFILNNIASQAAGEPFVITVTAQDIHNNTATQYTGKVNISDLSNTILPDESDNFKNGVWTGIVTISQNYDNNTVTVVNQGGSESGSSNTFNVIPNDVHHFAVSAIGNQQAGQGFSVTIRAEDSEDNLVSSFSGTATLSDYTGTLTPMTTTNFSGGLWSGALTITKSYSGNIVIVTGSGRVGTSNPFDVSPAGLDHFTIQEISSPKFADTPFQITIHAEDVFLNRVTSFNTYATLSDLTGTINPTTTTNFANGSWTGNVTITKKQNDVKITASRNGKSGESNIFNVNAGTLASFWVNSVADQIAGAPFLIEVFALDAHYNDADHFSATVNILDLTGTITPTTSTNFWNGKWSGNVTINQGWQNNTITVTNSVGSETGASNSFNVSSGALDHFSINTISSPQVAGIPFTVTITAQDINNNTVTGFGDVASLSDLSGTLTPYTTTNFVNGVWSGDVTITKYWNNNRISVTSGGKTTQSNPFSVTHNSLEYFEVENINSPQTAGVLFNVSFTAKDLWGNIVFAYNSTADLSDNTGTISPGQTGSFANGSWSGNVRITKSQSDVRVYIEDNGKTGQSNVFNVKSGALSYIKIMNTAGGGGQEVGARNLSLINKETYYAVGFDEFGNYSHDVRATWGATGSLDAPSPTTGKYTVFDPVTPRTSGKISADTTGITGDTTGQITAGSPAYVKIQNATGTDGVEIYDLSMTADENIKLYSDAYDIGGVNVGAESVQWGSTGNLAPAVNTTGTSFTFHPSTAPTSGKIIANHATITDDETGTITVVPGVPIGNISFAATPSVLPADGNASATVLSGNIYDADGNKVAQNTQFTVRTDLGIITSTDVNATLEGTQIAADAYGKIQFTLKAAVVGGNARITVNSAQGSAYGEITIPLISLTVISLSSPKQFASLGQTNVPVNMVVYNSGPSIIADISAGLTFTGPAPGYQNRNLDFSNIERTDANSTIQGFSTTTLSFNVDVNSNATNDVVTIDGWISGKINGVPVTASGANTTWNWTLQTPAGLKITKVHSLLDEVSQGMTAINISMFVNNEGQANAEISSNDIRFWHGNQNKDVTNEYVILPAPDNPVLIQGGNRARYDYSVSVGLAATQGQVTVNGSIAGTDVNTGYAKSDDTADTTLSWFIKEAAIVGIKGFYPTQLMVTRGQTSPWKLKMIVENNGGTAVRFDSTSLIFSLRGANVTSQYEIDLPTTFKKSNNTTLNGGSADTLIFTINETGTSAGDITITGNIYLKDLGTNNPIVDDAVTGVIVQVPANIKILNIIPSQNSVTQNQGQNWKIKVALQNEGGTNILIDMNASKTFVAFSTGADFDVNQPTSLDSGGLTLEAGSIDTLTFIVNTTGATAGNCYLSAKVFGSQTTSGETTEATFNLPEPIIIQTPARLRILSLTSQAPNPSYVNIGQVYPIQAILENNGGDEIKEATVDLSSSGSSISGNLSLTFADIGGNGGKKEQIFIITAASHIMESELFSATISDAVAENTSESMGIILESSPDGTEMVNTQAPANFQITNITVPEQARASQTEDWQINVAVSNNGGAAVQIQPPSANDIKIFISDSVRTDYIIKPPSELSSGGLILNGGQQASLVYIVDRTGEDAGIGFVEVTLTGNDRNDGQVFTPQDNANIYVQSTAAVQLMKTHPICFNYDGEKGLVNRGQNFLIRVWMQNLGRKPVREVTVNLTASGSSMVTISPKISGLIGSNEIDSLDFEITADPNNVTINEVFSSEIVSAIEDDTGLPAAIDNSNNNKARIAIKDSAKLAIDTWTETNDSVYTINQTFKLKAKIGLLGTSSAQVDKSGLVALFVPENYRIIVGGDTITNNNIISFVPEQTYEWLILTPEIASGPDTIRVSIFQPPNDKNLNQPAIIVQRHDSVFVRTEATDILYSSKISAPMGAKDGVVSTSQEFTIQTVIQYSGNLRDVTATLTLPHGSPLYRFDSPADSLQHPTNLTPVEWKIWAPAGRDNEFREFIVTIKAFDGELPILYQETLEVFTVPRAMLELNAFISNPEGAKDGIVTTNQQIEIKAVVSNSGTAKVYGNGFLEINLGATACMLADTTEYFIKKFAVDSAVTWNLIAPFIPMSVSNITVNYKLQDQFPFDENTNTGAPYQESNVPISIPLTTVFGGNLDIQTQLMGPAGALDGVLSTYQEFDVVSQIDANNVKDLKSKMILPENFSFYPNVNPVQEGESAQWRVVAPTDSVSNPVLKIVAWGKDSNNDSVYVYSDTAKVTLDIVRRVETEVIAEIISPFEATDGTMSVNQEFVVQAYLANHGQADFVDPFNLQLILPDGYSTVDNLKMNLSGSELALWQVKAPSFGISPKNIEIKVPPTEGPRDENSMEEVHFWQENRSDYILITTTEKTVFISKLPGKMTNVVVKGQPNVSLMGMAITNPADDEKTSSVLLTGFSVATKDKDGNNLQNPGGTISRMAVCDYNRPDIVYGEVTDFANGANVVINFFQPDTIFPGQTDSVDLIVTISESPELNDFMVVIASDTSISINEVGTNNIPAIEVEIAEQSGSFFESDFLIILSDNLKESFINYPNPFGDANKPFTTITYYLKQDTNVDIKIYTIIGELVWSRSYTKNDPQGLQGMHDVIWDARNDRGHKVLNGIYVIYLKTGFGEIVTTKAAVIK